MSMPESLVLVRHGESESNLAKSLYEQGQTVPAEADLMAVHTSQRRLTPLGVKQAQQAGSWLREHWLDATAPANMYRYFVSPYTRAMETAGHLGLNGLWQTDVRLVERNWGRLDQMPYSEREKQFADELKNRKEFAFFWRASDGETFQDVFHRLHSLKTRLRLSPARRVIMVCHGETMWVMRALLERWTHEQLKDAMLEQDERTRIHNCRIVEYSAIDHDGDLQPRFARVRLIDPSAPDDPERNSGWGAVVRPTLSDLELLEHCSSYPCFITNE